MSSRIIYNVEYDIPRVNLSLPGRQNRSGDGCLRITPGMDEPFEFVFGNQDGVPINLLPFQVKLIFWVMQDMDIDEMVPGQTKIVLSHTMDVQQPYNGRVFALLTSEDTMKIVEEQTSLVRWSLFMINEQGNVFPTEVNRNGGRAGTVRMDIASGMPIAEMVKSA
jgi:hypothetical protein